MLVSSIPAEILSQILSLLPKSLLFECMKVCKSWRKQCFALYYKDVVLCGSHVQFLRATELVQFRGNGMGDFVQALTFNPLNISRDQILNRLQFVLLLSNLPNLQVIRFYCKDNSKVIRDYLYYFKTIAKYTKVQEVYMFEFFEDPERFKSRKAKQFRKQYYLTNRLLQDQITSLTLHNTKMLEGGSNKLLRHLPYFKNLQHLVLNTSGSKDSFTQKINVTSIFKACPNLESLDLDTRSLWEDTADDQVHHQMKALKVNVRNMDQHHMQYLVHHVPHLKQLDVFTYLNTSSCTAFSVLNPDTVAYLRQLDYLNLLFLSLETGQDTACFWNLVRSIYDPQFKCYLCVQFRKESQAYWIRDNIHFDKRTQTFRVTLEWVSGSSDLPQDWVRFMDYFKFSAVRIEYHNKNNEPSLYNFMHPVFLEQQGVALFRVNRGRVVLGETIMSNLDELDVNRKHKIECAYFGHIKTDLYKVLETVGTWYPFIKRIKIVRCIYLKDGVVDLSRFECIEELQFDLDALLDVEEKLMSTVYIELANESMYCYKRDQDCITRVLNVPQENNNVIKILYNRLESFVFYRKGAILPVVDEEQNLLV